MKQLFRKNMVIGLVLTLVLACTGLVFAQKKPAENVSPKKHPHIAKAQQLTTEAFNQITAAQEANEWDMEGHAAKAKQLLDQANNELKQAAEAANKNKK